MMMMRTSSTARGVAIVIAAGVFATAFATCGMSVRSEASPARQRGEGLELPPFPDSRPILVVNGHGGLSDDPYGRRNAIRGGAEALVGFVRKTLDDGYRAGYRRFMLNQLAGHPRVQTGRGEWAKSEQHYIPMHLWQGMDARAQAMLSTALREWTARHPDAVLMVYLGIKASPRGAFVMPDAEATLLDVRREEHRRLVDLAIRPWREAGVRGVLFDWASAPEAEASFMGIKEYVESTYGMRVGGEAVPLGPKKASGAYDIDASMAAHSAWLGTTKFMELVKGTSEWRIDHSKHELILGIERREVTEALMRDWWRRGATFAVYAGPPIEEMALRISREGRR